MHRFFRSLMLALTLAVCLPCIAAEAAAPAAKRGVLRVKLQPELARQVGKSPRMKAGASLSTGAASLDRAAAAVGAVRIRPMLPYSEKFAERRAKYGLDRWYVVEFDENTDTELARKTFRASAGVEIAEPVTPMVLREGAGAFVQSRTPQAANAQASYRFNDPRLPEQWHYQNFGNISGTVAGADINLFPAWEVTTGSPEVVVAIIDGGIDYTHEDLAANMCINEAELNGLPGVDDDGNGFVDDIYGFNFCTNSGEIYPHSHGTHVAGTVGAVNNNGIGVCGVAGGDGSKDSGVRMISCQVFDSRSGSGDGDFAAAIIYAAERGATIAQCSWGWAAPDYMEEAVLDAIDYFTAEARSPQMTGGLCIFATGNEGQTGNYYPACYPKVLAVTAMTSSLQPASYSNYGAWADVIAPGGLLDYGEIGGVLSTLPGNKYGFNEGTSMATPHVSGIAALILSKHGSPTFTNEALRTQLVTSVNDFYGFGDNAQYEGLYGSGYIDAAKALSMDATGAPEAVTDFELQAAQDYISVAWTIPASNDNNVNNHIIYYSTEPFDANSDLTKLRSVVVDTKFQNSGDACTHELTQLEAMTTYYVAIRAVNRWGNASPLSAVKSVTTNAGPEMTIDVESLSMLATASQSTASAEFTIGNNADGLLKWNAATRTISAQPQSARRPVIGNVRPYSGKTGAQKIRTYARVAAEYEADDYPELIKYHDMLWANIGETDKTLPNSMAQWFRVDPAEYPEGFNLTHVNIEGANGVNPKVMIYKGDVAISSASLLQEVSYDWFAYNYPIALNEQLFFAPGEAFWVVVHFEAGQEGYPLGMGHTSHTGIEGYSYMSNDMGRTWTQLSAALKGSVYEPDASTFCWAITARSDNPDWSKQLILTPSQGSVRKGDTQNVRVTADGTKLVNGNYNFRLGINTNETAGEIHKIPVALSVSGNAPDVTVPKVVDFGSLLVGQSKTMTVEVYNRGYGAFRGSQWGAGLYDSNISCTSEHFAGPEFVSSGFPARSKVQFELTFTPKAAGSHTGAVVFTDADGRQTRILVQGAATEPARLAIEPSVVDGGTLTVGEDPVKRSFSISNTGKYPLEYVFPKFSDETIEGTVGANHKFGYSVSSTLEGYAPFAYDGEPALIGTTDISSSFSDSEYISDEIYPGFSFPYYGKNYDRIYISSFGAVMMSAPSSDEFFHEPLTPLSSPIAGTGMICAYGRQLQMSPESRVQYSRRDGKFVVDFSNVLARVYESEFIPVSFRIVLSSNGDIEIFYDDYDASAVFQGGSSLFCGINDPEMADIITLTSADMADYWEVEEPTPDNSRFRLFRSGTAVKFEAPKASFITALSAPHGLVSPGESVEIQATLAANADMIAGPSFNKLAILTNDPAPVYGSVRFDAVIAGDALVAEAALEKDDIDFGRVFRTSQLLVPVTVKNTGHDAMTITGISVTGGSPETDAKLGTVEAGMSKDIVLTIPTANEGPVDYEVTIGTTAGTLTAHVHGTIIGVPTLTLDAEGYNETIESGTPLHRDLVVANNGNEPLVYSVKPTADVRVTLPEQENAQTGYTYVSSIDDKNVKFDWVDIETNGLGTQNTFSYYNQHDYVVVELPFEFPFYGKKYSKMYVYNTGFVSFTERHDDKIWPEPPADFPGGSVYNNLIAPYWGLHSMDITKTAGTFHYVTDERAVVSFMEYGNSMNAGVCFQLIMERDGSFKFQYKGANQNSMLFGLFGLAGITNAGGTESIRLPERMVVFDQAVQFTPVIQNTVAPGESETVGLDFVTDRMAGVYESVLEIGSNVPGSERVNMPVSLTVTGEAAPVFPTEAVEVERTLGFMINDFSDQLIAMGGAYYAEFSIANTGKAAFCILDIANGGPTDPDWGDPLFPLFYYGKGIDFMGNETMGWNMFMGTPVEVGASPMKMAVLMTPGEAWMTPGTYEVPLTFTYAEGNADSFGGAGDGGTGGWDDLGLRSAAEGGEPEMKQATVMVRFIVTPAPAITFDKEMIHVENAADDHTSVETVAIGNEGEYSLKYTLELDASGIGDTSTEEDGGDVAPAFKPAKPAGVDTVAAEGRIAAIAKAGNNGNIYDCPSDFEYTSALYHPAMPGTTNVYNYGAGNTFDVYKAATLFKAPAEGFNISHIYAPVTIDEATNVDIRFDIVQGENPDGEHVLGTGRLHIESQENPAMGRFFVVPLEKSVYVNPGEVFTVVMAVSAGPTSPTYLCGKEEAVVIDRYRGWTAEHGWFDVGSLFEESYGSLGYIMSCIETKPGSPWVKLLDAESEGSIEPGASKEVKISVNAAAARMEKNNKAVLIVRSNDPAQPVVNYPIVLDMNGKPVIEAPEGIIYAKEGQSTIVTLNVSDPDGDDLSIRFDDATGVARVKSVTDAEGLPAGEPDAEGFYSVSGGNAVLVAEILPDFGQAGNDGTCYLTAADNAGHEAEATVRYLVEHVNRAPVATDSEIKIAVGSASPVISYAELFSDPDGDEMSYSFSMADNAAVEAYTTSTGVIFFGKNTGTATATVTATDAGGLTASANVAVTVDKADGITDAAADANALATIVENPVADDLHVLCHFDGKAMFELYGGNGAATMRLEAKAAAGSVVTMPTAACPAGFYLLRITCADGRTAAYRIIKL